MSGQEPRREQAWGRAQFYKPGTAWALAPCSPCAAPIAPSLGWFARDQGVHSGASHPVLALASTVGLGLLSPPPQCCADPLAPRGPSLTSLLWCLLTREEQL